VFDKALRARPTIIYFHGNAASRAQSSRVRSYLDFSYRLDCNVLAIDYRGFADSSGYPSEEGLLQDARATWDWIVERIQADGAIERPEESVLLVGHSLGTSVTAKLAGNLADEGIYQKAIVLLAPFTSLPDLLLTYKLGIIPLLGPFRYFPSFQRTLLSFLRETWDTSAAINKTQSPILLVHAQDDTNIPSSHSKQLFSQLASTSTESRDSLDRAAHIIERAGWGTVRRALGSGGKAEVMYFEGISGGHNRVGLGEGVMELIAEML